MDAVSHIKSIDDATLEAPVRRALQSKSAQILNWQVSQLGGGAGNPVSVGIFRYTGMAEDRGQQVPWSVILKVIHSPANLELVNMGEGDDQSHWNYWKRELFVYQSDLLQQLPAGMLAPQCFGVVERPNDVAWLWLEDVTDSYGGAWSLDRYALAARHLGQFNGLYFGNVSVPSFSWLSRHTVRQWVTDFPTILPHFFNVKGQPSRWEHPLALQRYPRPARNPFHHMLLNPDRILSVLSQLPQTLCHGDTYPTNLMSRRTAPNQEVTIALDWALVGVGPIGDDLGQLALGACDNLQNVPPAEIEEALFENYLDGLRDIGWRADPLEVRFGFTASAALRVGLFHLWLLNHTIEQEEARSLDEASTAPATIASQQGGTHAPFELRMAEEAYSLLDSNRVRVVPEV